MMFDLEKAKNVQRRLASRLEMTWTGRSIRHVAGVDCSYDTSRSRIGAVAVVLEIPSFKIVDVAKRIMTVHMPYVPGFLSFREGPSCIRAMMGLTHRPDVLLVDGNGIAHPRSMGLASYLGVVLGISTVGCAKSAFYPWIAPAAERGAASVYRSRGSETIGWVLRTRANVKPVFVSPGHRMDFETARKCVLDCSVFRIPEPIRQAHRLGRGLFGFGGGIRGQSAADREDIQAFKNRRRELRLPKKPITPQESRSKKH